MPSLAGHVAPVATAAPPVTAIHTPSGMPHVPPQGTTPDSRVSTPAVAHAIQVIISHTSVCPGALKINATQLTFPSGCVQPVVAVGSVLPDVGLPNWTPNTASISLNTPKPASHNTVSASQATPSSDADGSAPLQRRLSYGTPAQEGQRAGYDSESTEAEMAPASAHTHDSTGGVGAVPTPDAEPLAVDGVSRWCIAQTHTQRVALNSVGRCGSPGGGLGRSQDDLKKMVKTWKEVQNLHIHGAGLQSVVGSPNGTARNGRAPGPPPRSRKQKLPISSSPMGPSPHETEVTHAAALPMATKRPAPKQLAPRPPTAAPAPPAGETYVPQHQCNRPSIGASPPDRA
jgi:hypothetical protein